MTIETSDTLKLPYPITCLRIAVGGTMKVLLKGEPRPTTLRVTTGSILNLPIIRIYSTGTTASGFSTRYLDTDTELGDVLTYTPAETPDDPDEPSDYVPSLRFSDSRNSGYIGSIV